MKAKRTTAKLARIVRSSGTIRVQEIWARLRSILDPTGSKIIKPTDPVDRHIKGGPGAVRAFANVLNKSPQFSPDGLALVPGDLAGVDTIGQIAAAIISWYMHNGWKVVL